MLSGIAVNANNDPEKVTAKTYPGQRIGLLMNEQGVIYGVTCDTSVPAICFTIVNVGSRLRVDIPGGPSFDISSYEMSINGNITEYRFVP